MTLSYYVGKFAKIGIANGCANARITYDCELVRIANCQHSPPCQRSASAALRWRAPRNRFAGLNSSLRSGVRSCEFRWFANWYELRIANTSTAILLTTSRLNRNRRLWALQMGAWRLCRSFCNPTPSTSTSAPTRCSGVANFVIWQITGDSRHYFVFNLNCK